MQPFNNFACETKSVHSDPSDLQHCVCEKVSDFL